MSEKKSNIIVVKTRSNREIEVNISEEACNKFKLGLIKGGVIKAFHGDQFIDTCWEKDVKGIIIGEAIHPVLYKGDLVVKLDKDDGKASVYSFDDSDYFLDLVKI